MVIAAAAMGLTAILGTSPAWAASTAVDTSTAMTSTTTALTLAQWKQRYERVIGELADDALAVVKSGTAKSSANQSKRTAQVRQTITACTRWKNDSAGAGQKAPPIPSVPVQATWRQLIAASARAASDCSLALRSGTTPYATDFRAQLSLVNKDESRLVSELQNVG
jgi:hypothetical protein